MNRREYHPVQGAYVDKSAPPDPFIEALRAELHARAEHRAEPIEDKRGALVCAVCDRPVRTAHGGRFAVHAAV